MACSTTVSRLHRQPLCVSYNEDAAAANGNVSADDGEGIMGQGSCKQSSSAKRATSSIAPAVQQAKRPPESSSYRLQYFNVRGRAETTRMLFALAGVPFEDVRVSDEDWCLLKKGTPFGQLPVLEVNGSLVLCQQHSIERYVAGELGLLGRNVQETAIIDMIIECMRDTMTPIAILFNEPDQTKKEAMISDYVTTTKASGLQNILRFLNVQLRGPWFLGDQITLADVYVYNGLCNIKLFVPTAVPETGALAEWFKRFEAHPQIDRWIKTRPHTPY